MVTPEEKRYFDFLWKLASSRGIDNLDWEFYEYEFDNDFPLESEYFHHINGAWNRPNFKIPVKLSAFLSELFNEKIYPLIDDVFSEFDVDNEDGRVELKIDMEKRELTAYAHVYWLETGEEEIRIEKMPTEFYQLLKGLDPNTKSFHLDYSGGGDDGYLEDYIKSFEDESFPLNESIENFCYSLIPAGYENNEGGQGSFFFDMEERTITHTHSDNFEDSNSKTIFELEF